MTSYLQTQLDSYLQLQKEGQVNRQQRIIIHLFENNRSGMSRQDIAQYFIDEARKNNLTEKIKECSVCARINELLWMGKLVIVDRKRTKNQQILMLTQDFPLAKEYTKMYLETNRTKKYLKALKKGGSLNTLSLNNQEKIEVDQ